jgi:tetratricopeptide (TPR) repeat protein
LSKANTIRKKALEYARRQQWEPAIREYRRLAEIDQSNPNLYNELGDIFLKTGNKTEAYESFAQAVDAYARVSLYNNAVAVCKKVARLIPSRYEVLAKLGCIRKKQGLAKEAESYCLQYLDSLAQDARVDTDTLAKTADEITDTMKDCAVVLDRLAESLVNNRLDSDAAGVLARLHALYDADGIVEARDEVRRRLESMDCAHLITASTSEEPAKEGPVITEDNIWTDSLSEGERMSVDRDEPRQHQDEAAIPMGGPDADEGEENSYDHHTVELPDGNGQGTGDTDEVPREEEPPQALDLDDGEPPPAAGDPLQVSAIIDGEDDAGSDGDEDFRSHYDLGMAYLEMNLFAEAVREYQKASRSSDYQVKSLEMIGLCFLKQNQPQLAIKQLTRGLAQIDENDAEALGIKYNLGLAYEMIGEVDKAKAMFEDVYVVDVTFRDVAEKVAALSS